MALEEAGSSSGVFRLVVDTSERQSDPTATPPNLKVDKDDVITLKYRDEDPPGAVSGRLYVETAPPVLSNVGPPSGSANSASPEVSFDVTDDDSGVGYNDIWVIFAIDEDAGQCH